MKGQEYNPNIWNPGDEFAPTPLAEQFEDNNYLGFDYDTTIADFKINDFGYNPNSTRKAIYFSFMAFLKKL